MTPAERKQKLQAIIDQHDEAARALRETSVQFKTTAIALAQAYDAIEHAANHIAAVSNAVLTANSAALALFNEDEE